MIRETYFYEHSTIRDIYPKVAKTMGVLLVVSIIWLACSLVDHWYIPRDNRYASRESVGMFWVVIMTIMLGGYKWKDFWRKKLDYKIMLLERDHEWFELSEDEVYEFWDEHRYSGDSGLYAELRTFDHQERTFVRFDHEHDRVMFRLRSR